MKILTCLFILVTLTTYAQPPIIPLPNQYEAVAGTFTLTDNTPIIVKEATFQAAGNYLQQELLKRSGLRLAQQVTTSRPAIILNRATLDKKGSYELSIHPQTITISAGDEEGAFYGVISLLQLFAESRTTACWTIKDTPLYGWRGFMLDESRHFFGIKKVKQLLDQMAYYKLNRFHWHLTDEPGWRIEIKQYPRLTLIGGIGTTTDSLAAAQYYSQEEIKEIVRYAAERHITVIPEIDMPGHATAANKAYPAYSGGGSMAHPEFTFNPGKEETYQYLTNILKEVDVLFPSQMIHIGGDEVSFGNDKWLKDPSITKLMKEKNLKDVLAVEHYFLRRMADTIIQRNNQILGWDEVTQAKLPVKNTLVFWWRHDHPEQLQAALEKNFQVVLCPRLPFYFDFVQDSLHIVGRKWAGKFNPLEAVYNFSADTYPGVKMHRNQIQGIQANLWTETITSPTRLDFMIFPRLLALAEAAWTEKKNYQQFESRLQKHVPFLKTEGMYFFNPRQPTQTPEPVH
ncbi:MAG: beta-N-acetylhexosaminidase [Siphonobacter sp.]